MVRRALLAVCLLLCVTGGEKREHGVCRDRKRREQRREREGREREKREKDREKERRERMRKERQRRERGPKGRRRGVCKHYIYNKAYNPDPS